MKDNTIMLYWAGHKTIQKARKEVRRNDAPIILHRNNINFTSHNHGGHIIVEGLDCFIDFWPSREKWTSRFGVKGWGINNLIKFAQTGLSK